VGYLGVLSTVSAALLSGLNYQQIMAEGVSPICVIAFYYSQLMIAQIRSNINFRLN
jgi:hypothetical protein